MIFPAVLITTSVLAQKTFPAFGKPDVNELELKSCSFEPDAPAMKLFDVQETDFEVYTDGSTKFTIETRVRIKIFNEKGYKYANISIPYFSKKRAGKIKELSGIIYNQDASGKILVQKLTKEDFFKEKATDNVGIVNFTFPNLKPGSVIEYRYTRIEKNIIHLDPWIIQDEIPVGYSSYTVTAPEFSRINEKVFGMDTIEKSKVLAEGYSLRLRHIYHKENISSFKPEPFMSSYRDNLQKVFFLLRPGNTYWDSNDISPKLMWKLAGQSWLRWFGLDLKKIIPGTEKIIDSAKKIFSVEDRINFIYKEVKKRIPNKTEQAIYADDITNVWITQEGNSAEINLILMNLLQKANITSFALLVSTRDNGRVDKEFPSIGQLNGMDVLAVDTARLYFLDASLKFQSIQYPPLNILNREALLVNKDSIRWISIIDDRLLLKKNTNVFAEMKENGSIEGSAVSQYFDYARSHRLDSTLEENNRKKGESGFDEKMEGLKILSVKQENAEDDRAPLSETIAFTYEPRQTGNFYFIDPQFLSYQKKNPFVGEKRNTGIDFGCSQQIITSIQINFPSSYEIDHLPKNITVRAPDSSFLFKRAFNSNSSYILMQQVFEIRKPIFDKEAYDGIQSFFEHMYTLRAEEIILKRKK